MKTAKITEVKGFNERNGPHGLLYFITIKLDNGEEIQLGKKKSDAFKVGDTVSYEETTTEDGKKRYKEVKEDKPVSKYNPEAANRGAMVGMAYKLAFEVAYKGEDDFWNATALANRIFESAMDTYNGVVEEKKEEKSDNLPF